MENMDIRMFQDGDDFYICFKNINPDTKKFLQNLLNPVMEADSQLYAAEKAEEEIMIPESYKGTNIYGLSVREVLNNLGNRGYANIVYIRDKGDFRDKVSEVNRILGEYLFNTFSSIDPQEYAASLSEAEADEWIMCFSSLITDDIKNTIKNATGFSSFDDFKKEGTLEQKASLIYMVIMRMGFHQDN